MTHAQAKEHASSTWSSSRGHPGRGQGQYSVIFKCRFEDHIVKLSLKQKQSWFTATAVSQIWFVHLMTSSASSRVLACSCPLVSSLDQTHLSPRCFYSRTLFFFFLKFRFYLWAAISVRAWKKNKIKACAWMCVKWTSVNVLLCRKPDTVKRWGHS